MRGLSGRSQSLVDRHSCFEYNQDRHVIQRVWKCNCSDTWRSPTKWLSRWIVVFFMCAYEISCLLARLFKDTVFWWQPSPLASYHCFWDLITAITLKVPSPLCGITQGSCRDRSPEIICMIHGLVLTTHVEDELVSCGSCTWLLVFLCSTLSESPWRSLKETK
jgi:hypothetical protein